MKIFSDLAAQVESKYQSGDLTSFTAIATESLNGFAYDWSVEDLSSAVAKWMLEAEKLPKQISYHNTFGQPSVTVFNNEKFVVDLYFWVDFDTSIHSHGFRGAFRVLHGQSLHETFRASTVKSLANDIRLVDMTNIEREKLAIGDVREISPGLELTHRVIHLENPTVTLCVRTLNEPSLKQWTYLSTGLSIQKNEVTPDLLKKVLYFQYLFGRDEAQAHKYLAALLEQLSLSQQVHLYEDVASGSAGLGEEAAQALVETIVSKHENSEWWPPYEQAHLKRMSEVSFEHCQDPNERLVGHFLNCGMNYEQSRPYLKEVTSSEFQKLAAQFLHS